MKDPNKKLAWMIFAKEIATVATMIGALFTLSELPLASSLGGDLSTRLGAYYIYLKWILIALVGFVLGLTARQSIKHKFNEEEKEQNGEEEKKLSVEK